MPDPVSNRLVIALAQIPAIVGDIAGNRDRLREARAEAAGFGADIVLAPELYLSGYPPEDLVLKPAFQEACRAACEALARDTADGGPAVLVGLPWVEDGSSTTLSRCSTAAGSRRCGTRSTCPITACSTKSAFSPPDPSPGPIVFKGVRIGVPICEDIWGPDPVECILETGGEILLVPNASPYERDKLAVRQNIAVARVVESGLPLIYLNRSAARTNSCSRAALSRSTPTAASPPNCRPSARGRAHGLGARRARLALRRGSARCGRAGRRGRLCGLRDGPARLRRQQPLSGRRARPFGRRRFGPVRGDGGRRAGRRAGPRGHAALPIHLERIAADAAACAKALGMRYDIVPIAEPVEGVERALAQMFAGVPATSPKRTSRAGRAA